MVKKRIKLALSDYISGARRERSGTGFLLMYESDCDAGQLFFSVEKTSPFD